MENKFSWEIIPFTERQYIYKGLLSLVQSNSGIGFCNNEQGHPAYAIGREGKFDYIAWGDSPEKNKLFKIMQALSLSLCESEIDESSETTDYVFDWSGFCHLAYAAYEKSKSNIN